MEYVKLLLGVVHILLVFYFLYIIASSYFKIISIVDKKEYKGFYLSFMNGGFSMFEGIIPFLFYEKPSENKDVNLLINKRKKNVIYFWIVFLGGLFLIFIVDYLF